MGSLSALAITVALGHSSFLDESNPEYHFKLEVAKEGKPAYLWTQYEPLKIRILGQSIGDSSILSLGIGARKSFGQSFVFAEVGWGFLEQGARASIQHEIVYTELVNHHHVPPRNIPVDPKDYETMWEVDDGWLGAVGVGYQWNDHWSSTWAWRPFFAKEHIELYDRERKANDRGYWQESRSRDLSSFQLDIRYTF